jgi:dTMP kinase
MKGRFITLEGVDGAGKSSFMGFLQARLQTLGCTVLVTREPGGTPVGESLRRLLLDSELDPMTEALLLFAARREHLRRVIVPALDAGQWVLCDRFTDATFAYHGWGRGVDGLLLMELERHVQESLRPHLTLLFDLPIEQARARSAGARAPDRFEAEEEAFFQRVRRGYLARAAQDPDRFRIIDASLDRAAVEAQLTGLELGG